MLSRLPARRALRGTLVHTRLNSSRYRSIDEFNKQKKEFKFGPGIDSESDNFGSESQHRKLQQNFQSPPSLEAHPSLQGLTPHSAEYKYQLMLLQQQFQNDKEKDRARWELSERLKGLGAGVIALVGIISTYQIVMNYKYLKTYVRNMWAFDVDLSKVEDMNDPKHNRKRMANVVDRFTAEADASFVQGLKDSKSVPGLYLFGAVSGKKLPARVPGFDGMYLSDVLVTDDYVVAVDDGGNVHHYGKGFEGPVRVRMPGKVRQAVASGNSIFYIAQNGKSVFVGDRLVPGSFSPPSQSGWFSKAVEHAPAKISMDTLRRSERISSVAAGKDHLLLLTSEGRLFGMNTRENPENKGQFGLPQYAPVASATHVPLNKPFEMANLNNEVVTAADGSRGVKPRVFSAIAATKYASAAVEVNGNLWTWGDNSRCQCGRGLAAANDTHPVPKMVYSLKDLARIAKYSLADTGKNGTFAAVGLAAAHNTFYLQMAYKPDTAEPVQDFVLSFGDGLQGQLGVSRYIHMTHTPHVIKSLVGMQEYDEASGKTGNIGIKQIVGGGDHAFVTLDNAGTQKEVLAFGDNLQGQFGNGKTVKSAKPTQLPKLLEPEDFDKTTRALALKVNDQTKNRLQLGDGETKGVEQVLAAGEQSSAIYYRRK